MGLYNGTVITTAGLSLIANALAGGGTVAFTHAKTSSYVYPEDTDFSSLTDLENIEQTVEPFSAQIVQDNTIQVSAQFTNEDVASSYMIQNIGLYAQLGDDDEILFCINSAQQADQMPETSEISPSSFIYNIQAIVQNASSIEISVNPAGTATVQDLIDLKAQMEQMIAAHNVSPSAHQDIRNLINTLTSRVQRLEDMVLANVTENPFLVQFDTLDGLSVTGVWNVAQERIEF